ncbi:MAG: cysteine--tRNA ligase, partial [Gammaproteobacteria bacterium]|nr:cysteine--tRNA ligase [Gammaproteobacteria bacterium]
LGIGRHDPEAWLERRGSEEGDEEAINRLVAERNQARRDKDFATADRIRDELAERGVVLEDGPDGTKWRKVG